MLDIAAKTQAPRDRRMHRSLRAGAYGLAAVVLIYCAALAVVFILGQSLPDEPAAARLPAVAIVFYDNATSMPSTLTETNPPLLIETDPASAQVLLHAVRDL